MEVLGFVVGGGGILATIFATIGAMQGVMTWTLREENCEKWWALPTHVTFCFAALGVAIFCGAFFIGLGRAVMSVAH